MDVQFAFQFPINSNGIYNISFEGNSLFKKSEYNIVKRMHLPPIAKKPSEHFQKITDDFTKPILEYLIKLKKIIEDHKGIDNKNVENYVPIAIDMCIRSVTYLNRIKMERMMIIIRTGINSNAVFEITEALVNLEYIVKIFYPEDRRCFSSEESEKLKKSIIDMTIVNPKSVIKLLEDINLEASITKNIREILTKVIIGDRSKILNVILEYLSNINKSESIINSTVSISETFEMINLKQIEFMADKANAIQFSTLTISVIVIEGEMYVDYFGFVDKPIGGSFSLDFYRFRNFINDNITYYLFYLVTCHYCMMHPDNILNVNFGVIPIEIPHMFIFFEAIHMNKLIESIEGIPISISYKKIFAHLYKFFYELMGRKKPENGFKLSDELKIVPNKELPTTHKNDDKNQNTTITESNKNTTPNERLNIIKQRNINRKKRK